MIAVLFRSGRLAECSEFGAAYQDVRLTRTGIEVDQFAAVDIGYVLAVRGPGDAAGWASDQAAMPVDLLNGQRWRCLLGNQRTGEQRETDYGPQHKSGNAPQDRSSHAVVWHRSSQRAIGLMALSESLTQFGKRPCQSMVNET